MRIGMIGTLAILFAAGNATAAEDAGAMKKLEAKDWTVPGIEMKMNLIPAGTFTMGSPKNEKCRREDEVQHKATISKPFYMDIHEVTQRQFYKLMMPDYDFEAWKFKRGPIAEGTAFCYRYPTRGGLINGKNAIGGELTDLNPMECVTWERACEFCKKLTETERKAGRLPEGYVYRLPTEAEWEYACRAGTEGPYNVEADVKSIGGIRGFAWVADFNGVNMGTRAVGLRKPNAWGLYDMHGNVYEWCHDWYAPYEKGAATDPKGPAEGKEKVVRGGSFSGATDKLSESVYPFLRSSSRYRVPPDLGYLAIVGFRVVLAVEIAK